MTRTRVASFARRKSSSSVTLAAPERHDRIGDVEGERVPAQRPREASDARKRRATARDERRGHREDEDPREQASSGGDHERGRRTRELVEEARHGAIVLVIVEHDEALAAREKLADPGQQGATLARRAVPEREHLGQRPEVPGADAKPVDVLREPSSQPVSQGAREHRLAAAARAHESEPGGTRGVDGPGEGRELAGAAFEAAGRGREVEGTQGASR